MYNNFFRHIDIDPNNVHILDGNAKDLKKVCTARLLMSMRSSVSHIFLIKYINSFLPGVRRIRTQNQRSRWNRALHWRSVLNLIQFHFVPEISSLLLTYRYRNWSRWPHRFQRARLFSQLTHQNKDTECGHDQGRVRNL